MITMRDFMETVNYRITEGSSYGWACYGENAYSLDSWNGDNDTGHNISIVFDTDNQVVYEMSACDYKRQRAYRWFHPDYKKSHDNESADRTVDMNQAWDDVNFVELETPEDMLEKAQAIVADEDYDTRVQVPIDFSDEELLKYMKLAHERDMTFNQYVEEALRSALAEFERDPEGMKARADHWKSDHDIA